jgi:hypothetical protein
VVRALAVLVVAGIGYAFFIPVSKVDRHLLGHLVITRSAEPGVPAKAALAEAVPPAESTFAVTRKAAKTAPDATGLYAREWYLVADAPPEVGIIVQLLPDAARARTVFAEVRRQLATAPTLQGEKAAGPTSFSVPGVAGAIGYSFSLSDTVNPAKGTIGSAYKAAYQVDRSVVTELMISTSPSRELGPIRADVRNGAALLRRAGPGFSFVRTTMPLVATIVYAVVAVAAALLAVAVPEFLVFWRRRRRERRLERETRRAREQYLVRGRRTVKRQRAPAWSQPRRR